jgi:hypothetical protein
MYKRLGTVFAFHKENSILIANSALLIAYVLLKLRGNLLPNQKRILQPTRGKLSKNLLLKEFLYFSKALNMGL